MTTDRTRLASPCGSSLRFDRRGFLRHAARTVAAAGTAKLLSGCGPIGLPPPVPSVPTDRRALVAAVRGRNLTAMTRDALHAVGGIEAIIHPDETVFIKANFSSAEMFPTFSVANGDMAKPEVVIAAAEACLAAGAALVTIGEAGQVPRFSWDRLATLDGQTTMAAEAERLESRYPGRVALACLNSDSPGWDAIPSPCTGLGELRVSSLATRADRVISVNVLKTNRWTQISGSLKNLVGLTPAGYYGRGTYLRMRLHDCPGGIVQSLLDIADAVRPDLSILDASICVEGNGPYASPWWGNTVDMRERIGDWVVFAGTDPVAVDSIAAYTVAHEAVEHIEIAHQRGLGQAQRDMIDVVGAPLDELRTEWRPAQPATGILEVLVPAVMLALGH